MILNSDLQLNYNELQNTTVHIQNSFPSGAREGQIIYHIVLKSFCICIDDTIATTSPLAWKCGIGIGDPIGIRANCTINEEIFDAVYVSDNNTVLAARADNILTSNVIGFIKSKETDTNCTIVTNGLLSGFDISGGITLIAGKQYFLSKKYNGGITDVPPTSNGNVLARVGIGFNSDTLIVDIDRTLTIRA